MKNKNVLKISLFAILVWMLVGYSLVWAVADTYDNSVKVRETATSIIYYGTIQFTTGDSISNHFTQFFQIDDCNQSDAYIWAVCSNVAGTEDVNVIAHYSANTDTSILSSLNSGNILDQVQTTMKCDTLNVYAGAHDTYFSGARWCRLNFDGQTGNPVTLVSWWAVFKKNNAKAGCQKQILNHKV